MAPSRDPNTRLAHLERDVEHLAREIEETHREVFGPGARSKKGAVKDRLHALENESAAAALAARLLDERKKTFGRLLRDGLQLAFGAIGAVLTVVLILDRVLG